MRKRKAQAPDLEKYLAGKGRRFVNYAQGAKLYDLSDASKSNRTMKSPLFFEKNKNELSVDKK